MHFRIVRRSADEYRLQRKRSLWWRTILKSIPCGYGWTQVPRTFPTEDTARECLMGLIKDGVEAGTYPTVIPYRE